MADVDLTGKVTLLDLAQETQPGGGRFVDVAKILTKVVPPFQDAHWEPGNQTGGHLFGRDAYLPNGGFRAINNGIDATAGRTDQETEPISLYQDRAIVDEELIALADAAKPGGGVEFRARKDDAHLRGGGVWLGDKFLYGARAVATPRDIDGFATRRPAYSGANCLNCGDASENAVTSAYLINWGPDKTAFLYPPMHQLQMVEEKDMGKQLTTGANSKQFWAYVTEFYFRFGIMVMDERYLQRLANIGTTTANKIDIDKLIELYHNMDEAPGGAEGAILYVGKTGYMQLEQEVKNLGEHVLKWVSLDNKADVMMFKGNVPVKKWSSIKDTEAVLAS